MEFLTVDLVVEVFLWAIVGAIAGYFATRLVPGARLTGELGSIVLGMAGAFVGAGLINLFAIDLGLDYINISLQDLIAAFVGSVLLLAIIGIIRR